MTPNGTRDMSEQFTRCSLLSGLEFLHQLTKYGTYDLRVDMTDFEQHKDWLKKNGQSLHRFKL